MNQIGPEKKLEQNQSTTTVNKLGNNRENKNTMTQVKQKNKSRIKDEWTPVKSRARAKDKKSEIENERKKWDSKTNKKRMIQWIVKQRLRQKGPIK